MLKTTNFLIAKTKQIMPTAVACITKIETNGLKGVATLSIQSSRENCELVRQGKLEAVDKVMIDFDVDYNKHISTIIYETAKVVDDKVWDRETNSYKDVKRANFFANWDNDIK